jgi:hypothetical protein
MPNKWNICKEGQAGNKKRQSLVFSELPSLPSAGSRPGCFQTSLGCELRSLIQVSLGCSIIQKNVRKYNPTPAYSPVSDRRRLTALVEVHWAKSAGIDAPDERTRLTGEPHNRICKEEGCAVSTQETAARRKWEMEYLTRLSAPWTDSRSHPRIVNQLAGGNQYNANL